MSSNGSIAVSHPVPETPNFASEKPVGDPRLYTFFNKHVNILGLNKRIKKTNDLPRN